MGGTRVNPSAVLAVREKKSTTSRLLEQNMAQIEETGCRVKDLDIGLLDFPILLKGKKSALLAARRNKN